MHHGEEMEESKMEGIVEWWEHLPEDKKKAMMKAKLEMKIKKVQARLDFLKENAKNLRIRRSSRASSIEMFEAFHFHFKNRLQLFINDDCKY